MKLFLKNLFASSKSIKENIFSLNSMMQTKKYLIASVIGITVFAVIAVVSFSSTGFFSKAFSKTVQPNQVYQENVLIRKFYIIPIHYHIPP